MLEFDVLVVGLGAAGMAAAAEIAGGGKCSVLAVDSRPYLGGVLPQCIHSGFGNGLTGPEYEKKLEKEFLTSGAIYMLETTVVSVSPERFAFLSCRAGMLSVHFKRLVLATGCREIPFGALGIAGTRPKGIFTAGQVQEMINLMHADIGGDAVIIGCGDLGMIVARRLVLSDKKVRAIIEKNPTYGGLHRNYANCIEKYDLPVLFSTTVEEVIGRKQLQAVRLSDGETIPCETLIVAAGLKEEQTLVKSLGSPDWLTLCGNCRAVCSMVETAVGQARDTAVDLRKAEGKE